MARLFITPREMNFISDITKEIVKDVVGQRIYYYPVSEVRTRTHGIYNEAIEKVFDGPIVVDALVDNVFQSDSKVDRFGVDAKYRVEAFVQYRDLIDKGITLNVGDFFSFGDIMYEISDLTTIRNIYGQPEHKDGVRIVGTKARSAQFGVAPLVPTDIAYADIDPGAVQTKFEQQRGASENSEGPTGDVRDLVRLGVLDQPLSGPQQVSEAGAASDASNHGSSFYDEG